MDLDIFIIFGVLSVLSTIVTGLTEWPSGLYALPMPRTGCPGPSEIWETTSLYFNLTTEIGETVSILGKDTHLSIDIESDYVRFDVCSRTQGDFIQESKDERAGNWPKGRYCILHVKQLKVEEVPYVPVEPTFAATIASTVHAQSCPDGFTKGTVPWPNGITSLEGTLSPSGYMDGRLSSFSCCREPAIANEAVEFPITSPFYTLQAGSSCQEIKGMTVKTEYLEWSYSNNAIRDTENQTSHVVPAIVEGGNYKKESYCYYTRADIPKETYVSDIIPGGNIKLIILNATEDTPALLETANDLPPPPDYTQIKIAVGVVVIGTPGITLLVLCICRARNIHMKRKFLTRDSYRMTSFTYQSSFTTRRYSNSPPSSDSMVEKPQKEFTYKFQNHRLRIENPSVECEV
ncbi:uncharacterized protein LOC144441068 [Glandiceps talaboti]